MYVSEYVLVREMRDRIAAAERRSALMTALKEGRPAPVYRKRAAGLLLRLAERLSPELRVQPLARR